MSCLFCNIVSGNIPASTVFESKDVLAFRDIAPQAPVHILVIPKQHITSAHEVHALTPSPLPAIFDAIHHIAEELNLSDAGYRIVTNVGNDGGQTVSHLHFHILGGRSMQWPPG
ncbi:MAG: histidine triad nucleotide-binding protein [bacterium]|nr:histidine triad nucleotide-binding protein [bacterium]